jgi:hypothetical protein
MAVRRGWTGGAPQGTMGRTMGGLEVPFSRGVASQI